MSQAGEASGPVYDVTVGNIGTVYSGPDGAEAVRTYLVYLEQSTANYGRAAGESVILFRDGDPLRAYLGSVREEA